MTVEGELEAFWALARRYARMETLPGYLASNMGELVPPPAWSFGGTPEQADELLELVLSGKKTATASAKWDYDAEDEPLPAVGALSILLDGTGRPRALIRTDRVEVVPFDQVDAEHAYLEGEGDRSLEHWREAHRRFFAEQATHAYGVSDVMPVVLERFELLYFA